jgi:hypothetical protein
MDIRKDIYSIPEAQNYLQALAYRTQEAFPTIFPTVDDVIKYVNNFKNAKIAELFLDIGYYYNSAKYYKCPKCFPPKRIDTCPNCGGTFEMPAFIVLIMVISVMEKLASVDSGGIESWVDFYDWVSRKDINKEYTQGLRNGKFKNSNAFVDSLKARWSLEFGSLTKVTNFLKAIMNPEEKRELIKSIRYFQKIPNLPPKKMPEVKPNASLEDIEKTIHKQIEDEQEIIFKTKEDIENYVKNNEFGTTLEALPICFDSNRFWNCYAIDGFGHGQGFCRFKYDCTLLTNLQKLDKCFKETVRTIYDWRSKFVHDAKLPPVRETAINGTIYKGKYVVVELTTSDFKKVFEKLVKKFFDKFQNTV